MRNDILILDIETCSMPGAEQWVRQPKAASNLKDPDKIAADIAEKTVKLHDSMALDWNTNQIVAMGLWPSSEPEPIVATIGDLPERELVAWFQRAWKDVCRKHGKLLGFHIRQFDCPTIIQKCRLEGVPEPLIDLSRYRRNRDLIDLYDILTFDQMHWGGDAVMAQSLDMFYQRFGLPPVADPCDGKDVPALVTTGDYETVAAHCRADLMRLRGLSERLGYLAPAELCSVQAQRELEQPF